MTVLLKPVFDGFLRFLPHVKALGIGFHGFGDNWAELALPYAEHLVAYPGDDGMPGIIASGAIFSLMDTVGGMSVVARSKRMVRMATLDLRIDYLRAAEPGRDIFAEAHCYKVTRSVAFVRAVAFEDSPENPVANATAAFMIASNGGRKMGANMKPPR